MSTLDFLRPLIKVLQTFVGPLSITGKEHLPTGEPFILVINHMSVADPPLVLMAYGGKHIRFFAGEKWKRRFVLGTVLQWAGAIYINRGEVDRKALRAATTAVREGHVFALAPEGTRSKVSHLIKGKDGVAFLANRVSVPIVPMGIINTDVIGRNLRRLRRTRLQIIIGEPFRLPAIAHRPRGSELSAYTHYIMIHIAALLPERYWGYYADSKALQALISHIDPWPACLEAENV